MIDFYNSKRQWKLLLNDMRSSKIEMRTVIASADSREELLQLLKDERVATYRDDRWGKSFRQGGPLEWCNQPFDWELDNHFVDTSPKAALKRMFGYRLSDVDIETIDRIYNEVPY